MTKPENLPAIRLFINQPLGEGYNIEPDKNQCNYLLSVMRLESGDEVRVFNEKGGEWLARIEKVSSKKLLLHILSRTREFENSPDLWLLFAPVKSHAMDNIITKATEMGVSVLQPVVTRNTVVGRVNIEKIKAGVIEAAEQCERLDIPEVKEAAHFEKAIAGLGDRPIIYCDETGNSADADTSLKKLTSGEYALIIGPEGGFAKEELEILKKNPNSIGMTLGPRILKADTAVVAAIAVFMSRLGDWDKKPSFRG